MKISSLISGIINFIVRAAIVVVVIYAIKQICIKAYDYGYRIYSEPPMAEDEGIDIVVDIPMGSSAADTGKILKDNGLIRDDRLFYMQELLSDYHGKTEPGTYKLNTSMTAEEMLAEMSPSVSEDATEEESSKAAEAPEPDASEMAETPAEAEAAEDAETAEVPENAEAPENAETQDGQQ